MLNDVGPLEERLLQAEKERDNKRTELTQKDVVIKRMQDALDNDNRQLKEKVSQAIMRNTKSDGVYPFAHDNRTPSPRS